MSVLFGSIDPTNNIIADKDALFVNLLNGEKSVQTRVPRGSTWSVIERGVYLTLSSASGVAWGSITGTLSNQTDLQNALNAKQNLITLGTEAQYFRGDLTLGTFADDVLGTLISGLVVVDSPVIDGDSIITAIGELQGQINAFTAGDVPSSRTLTINGTTFDLSANRTWNVGTVTSIGISGGEFTIGSSPVTISGTITLALATSGVSANTYGSATQVPVFAVNSKGIISSVTNTAIQITESQVTNLVTDLAAKQTTTLTSAHILVGNGSNVATSVAASGDLTLANTGAFTLKSVGTSGNYNNINTDAQGRVTSGSLIAYLTANQTITLTGDITGTGTTTFTTTLATVNSNVGTFGDGTHVAQVTVNAKGLVTAVTSVTITGVAPGGSAGGDLSGTYPNPTVAKINGVTLGTVTATTKNILMADGSAWQSVSVSGDMTVTANTGTFTLATVNTTTGSYGSATQVATFTVNGKGLVTVSGQTSIQITESQVTNLTTDLAAKQSTTLTNTHILVGNASNVATDVAMSGDATLANTGAITIANNAVTYAKFQQVAASSLVGNATGSLANATGITLGSTLIFSASSLRTIAMTGDITTIANSFATTLATVNTNTGSWGTATQVAQFTVNGKGLITAAANVTITPAASSITGGAALTKTDDTNVTLTLGGTPTTALLVAASLTLGWTGQLGLTRGGTAANLTASNGGIVYSTASAMAILAGNASSNFVLISGASAAPSWSTSLSVTGNTVTNKGSGTTTHANLNLTDSSNTSAFKVLDNGTLLMSNTSAGSSTAPVYISMGSSFGNTPANSQKIKLYDDNSGTYWGFGISSGQQNYVVPSGGGHYFYVDGGTTAAFLIKATTGTVNIPTFTTSGGLIYTNSSGDLIQSSKFKVDSTGLVTLTASLAALSHIITNSLATSNSYLRLVNDVGTFNQLGIYGSTNTPYGAIAAGSPYLYFTNTATIMVDSGSSPLIFATGGNTETARLDASGNFSISGSFNAANVQTTVSGSVSGTAVFSMTFRGSSFKQIIIYCSALVGTAIYNFPTAFTFTPEVISQSIGGVVTTISSSSVTLTGTTSTGFITLNGY